MGNTQKSPTPPEANQKNPLNPGGPSDGAVNPLEGEVPITPRGTLGPAPMSPQSQLPDPNNKAAPATVALFGTDWCCGGENRGHKDRRGARKRQNGSCGQSTLADCESVRAHEERVQLETNQQLVLAATVGDVERIRSLIKLDADINWTKGDKTSLHLAAHSGQEKVLEFLVRHKADTNFLDQDLRSPLHVACLNGNAKMCELLLDPGEADANMQDKSHMLPLHFACVGGHYEIVEVLLKAGALVEVDKPKVQPLHFASLGGHCRIAALLLDFHADVDRKTKRDEESPLHLAASRGRNGTVALLLWRKAGVDARNVHKCTPMHLAARRNHLDTVRLLLNARADAFATQRNDWTPMLIAFKEGNLELGRFLQKLALERPPSSNGAHEDKKNGSGGKQQADYSNGGSPIIVNEVKTRTLKPASQ